MNNTTVLPNQQLSIKEYIQNKNVQERISVLLKERASQFIITITSMVNNDEKLAVCEPKSLVFAALTITAMDLPVNNNLGFAWIIPYKDTKSGKTYAQVQLGYKGFIQLSMRSNQFKTINASDVRDGEYKGINRLSGDIKFKWIDKDREKLKIIGFVAYFKLLNGFSKSIYMTAEELKGWGLKYSQVFKKYNTGQWANDFEAMARKTVIKQLLSKYAPMSTTMAKAVQTDQAIIEGEDQMRYLDNEKQTAEEISAEKEKKRIIIFIENAQTPEELENCEESCDTDELKALYDAKKAELSKKVGVHSVKEPREDVQHSEPDPSVQTKGNK